MEMKIDINGSIKELSKWRKNLNYDTGDYCYGDGTTRYSLDTAIETMRKYQKIEDIYYHQSGQALENSLRAVIEDGTNEKTSD